jgi:hypothetical protein
MTMTLHDRQRTEPVPAHAYTLPIVRETPIRAGLGAGGTPPALPESLTYPGSTAW